MQSAAANLLDRPAGAGLVLERHPKIVQRLLEGLCKPAMAHQRRRPSACGRMMCTRIREWLQRAPALVKHGYSPLRHDASGGRLLDNSTALPGVDAGVGFPLAAARRQPAYFNVSAWLEHAPFAFWLIDALRPTNYVELGSHYGFSYFAVCQTVATESLATRCYAIDTWEGDEHASRYGEDVYKTVVEHNRRYAAFSTLIRSRFSDALPRFADGSIDLLHVDGRHYYEDVKEDFETWVPKLTPDAIVLFHDTQVRERNFGVWKYFGELRDNHRTFEFMHGHGLGVLAMGQVPKALQPLFGADEETTFRIRRAFEALGAPMVRAWADKRHADKAARRKQQWLGMARKALTFGRAAAK